MKRVFFLLLAACATGPQPLGDDSRPVDTSAPTDSAGAQDPVRLDALRAWETDPVGRVQAQRGRYIVAQLRLANRTDLATAVAAPTFLLETVDGLQRPGDPLATAELQDGCPVDALVAPGAALTCTVAFDLASAERPQAVVYPVVQEEGLFYARAEVTTTPCTRCGKACVDVRSDGDHCGACGVVVPEGATCVGGVPTCPGDLSPCSGACVDLLSDPAHCGACGVVVPQRKVCVEGVPECRPLWPDTCNGGCVNLATDPSHCGTCGRAVGSGQTCQGGNPVCPSPAQAFCASQCTDTRTSVDHCGACDHACGQGYTCQKSTCAMRYTASSPTTCDAVCSARSKACIPGTSVSFYYSGIAGTPVSFNIGCDVEPASSRTTPVDILVFDYLVCQCSDLP